MEEQKSIIEEEKVEDKAKDKSIDKLLERFDSQLKQQIKWTNANKINPPFIHDTFANWRADLYTEFSEKIGPCKHKEKMSLLLKFSQLMTKHLLKYADKIRKPYQT